MWREEGRVRRRTVTGAVSKNKDRAISIYCNVSFVRAAQDSDWQHKRQGMKGKQQLVWELLLFPSWQVEDRKDDNSVFAEYRPPIQLHLIRYTYIDS